MWGFLVAQMVKNLPAIQEIQVQSLGGKYTLEKGMATHSSILTWRIPWTEEPGWLQSMGLQSWTQLKQLSNHTYIHIYIYMYVCMYFSLGYITLDSILHIKIYLYNKEFNNYIAFEES